jgi:hypothetical protein
MREAQLRDYMGFVKVRLPPQVFIRHIDIRGTGGMSGETVVMLQRETALGDIDRR